MKLRISALFLFLLFALPAFGEDVSKPAGSILRQVWDGLPGSAITDITGNPDYPNYPTRTENPARTTSQTRLPLVYP